MLELRLNGPVVDDDDTFMYEWLGSPYVSPKAVLDFLKSAGNQDISLAINSKGGSVFAGSEIYDAIKKYEGHVEVVVVGIAASISSIIAMAGDTIKMSPLGQIMIHNASAENQGDYRQMDKFAGILFDTSESMARVYAQKTGLTVEEMMDLMNQESYFTAEKAVEIGLADEVLYSEKLEFSMIASSGDNISKNKIAEFKAILTQQNSLSNQQNSLTIEAVEKLVSKIIDEKLSDKTIKSQLQPENKPGLENYIYLGGKK